MSFRVAVFVWNFWEYNYYPKIYELLISAKSAVNQFCASTRIPFTLYRYF
jgi:hypothetical protein